MPSKILSAPFLLLVFVLAYLTWCDDAYIPYLFPPTFILMLIYVFSPQIDWWWYKRHPPDVEQPIRKMLGKMNLFYINLSLEDKTKFRQRLKLFMMGVEFTPQGWDSVPEDVKYIIAANAVQLNFHKEVFLFPKYEKIIVYPTPFPSPQYPQRVHPSEVYKEDGVLLFSAQQVMWGFMQPQQHYNIAMHEYVKVFRDSNPQIVFPVFTEEDWPKLSEVSSFSERYIKGLLNVPDIDPTVVAVTLFQTAPENFKEVFPEQAEQLASAFGA